MGMSVILSVCFFPNSSEMVNPILTFIGYLFTLQYIFQASTLTWKSEKNWLIKKIVISRVQQQSTALNRVYGPFLLDQYLTLFLGDFVKVKSSLIVYHDVIYHLSYSNHGEFIFGSKCWIWRIFSKFLEDFSR